MVLKFTVVPEGIPEAVRLMAVLYTPVTVVPNETDAVEADAQVILVDAGDVNSNPFEDAVMVKFALEISKNILPTASIFIRAVVDALTTGMVITSVPSLGVDSVITKGKVWPLSVDKEIFTFAQLTGVAVVEAAFHVIVCDVEAPHETFVLGAVTVKGPAALDTVTTILVNCVCPTFIGEVEL